MMESKGNPERKFSEKNKATDYKISWNFLLQTRKAMHFKKCLRTGDSKNSKESEADKRNSRSRWMKNNHILEIEHTQKENSEQRRKQMKKYGPKT